MTLNHNRLKLAVYENAERQALIRLPNRVVEAFQAVVFQSLGYPFRVREESELFKYVDVMHELRFEETFSQLLESITTEELELLRTLTEQIHLFCKEEFNGNCVARASVLRALNVFRHIRYLFGEQKPRVFEIGPGCGYLGAMLLLEGYPYAATDISQAFYLYQNHLWNFLSAGHVFDGAEQRIGAEQLRFIQTGVIAHLPWWDFVELKADDPIPFDVVTCNHALCEMHPDSLSFTLLMAQHFLRREGLAKKAFIFEGWGWSTPGDISRALRRFYDFGFVLVHNDDKVTVFAPADTEGAQGGFPLSLDPKQRLKRLILNSGRRVLGAVPLGTDRFLRPPILTPAQNSLSQSITAGRKARSVEKQFGIEELFLLYTALLGSEDHLSADESFWKMIGRHKH
ncbi:MAG: hypothetical protein HY645_08325 [Acidobacteria bacterium]|nr:hypothetical protein [Acidobacteriota bacterium]